MLFFENLRSNRLGALCYDEQRVNRSVFEEDGEVLSFPLVGWMLAFLDVRRP